MLFQNVVKTLGCNDVRELLGEAFVANLCNGLNDIAALGDTAGKSDGDIIKELANFFESFCQNDKVAIAVDVSTATVRGYMA